MDDVKKSYFTTGQMRNALIQIEDQMVHSNWMPDIILGINRGGCIPGVYLSHRLKIPHETIDIRKRQHIKQPDFSALEKAYNDPKNVAKSNYHQKILIIDDINDTGATFQWLIDNFGEGVYSLPNSNFGMGDDRIRFAALIHNKQSKVAMDYKGSEIDIISNDKQSAGIVFPWEEWDK